jgi:hypothetical protein
MSADAQEWIRKTKPLISKELLFWLEETEQWRRLDDAGRGPINMRKDHVIRRNLVLVAKKDLSYAGTTYQRRHKQYKAAN